VSGSPTIGTHLPSEPPLLHASHAPLHAESQQTPSAQCPDAHSPSALHAVPFRFAHKPLVLPALHDLPAPQEPTLQQTPSVQNPLEQVLASVQVVPSPSMTMHAPDLQ
jgi:hypothetical protein